MTGLLQLVYFAATSHFCSTYWFDKRRPYTQSTPSLLAQRCNFPFQSLATELAFQNDVF